MEHKYLYLLLSLSTLFVLVQGVCKNANIPQRQTNDNCAWYNDLSCCNQSAVSRYSDGKLATQCTSAARSCRQEIVQLLCGMECAPAYSSWIDSDTGKVRVCALFADNLYFQCKDSEFQQRDSLGQFSFSSCDTLKNRYTDSVDLITNGFDMQYAADNNKCFNEGSLLHANIFLLLIVLAYAF